MKILIPILSFGHAGGYRVLSMLANELVLLGHDVEFLSPEGSNKPYFNTIAKVSWIDKNGDTYQQEDHLPVNKDNFCSIQKKLTSALKKIPVNSYDVVLANHSLTILPVIRNGLQYKTLYYVQAYEPDYYKLMGGFRNKILRVLSSMSYRKNIYTVINADVYRRYKKLNTSKVLYPGVDFDLFYPQEKNRVAPSSVNDAIIIGTVGRLEKFKGTIYVLDAFKVIRQKYPAAQLHIAFGDPSDYQGYDGIHCFQPKGDKALGDYYRSLDYYFCAGFTQMGAFHYPVVEAMCCGVPVITTQYYPADNNNAWLTNVCDVPDIIIKFEQAYNSLLQREKKVQQAIADTRQFDWKKTGKQLDMFLNELLNNSKQKTS